MWKNHDILYIFIYGIYWDICAWLRWWKKSKEKQGFHGLKPFSLSGSWQRVYVWVWDSREFVASDLSTAEVEISIVKMLLNGNSTTIHHPIYLLLCDRNIFGIGYYSALLSCKGSCGAAAKVDILWDAADDRAIKTEINLKSMNLASKYIFCIFCYMFISYFLSTEFTMKTLHYCIYI